MDNLRKKIEIIMRSSDKDDVGFFGLVLYVISLAYGLITRVRIFLYMAGVFKTGKVACKVISVGNITVGGTGKTPMAVYIAKMIVNSNVRVAVASRGYGGSLEKKGGVVSDGEKILLTPEKAGDEPCLIAEKLPGVPVVVGKNRVASGALCVSRFNTQVLVLDDAFSHLAVKRDLDLVLLDSRAPFGNNHLLPRGILREPVKNLDRAHALIMTRFRPGREPENMALEKPVFLCSHKCVAIIKHRPSLTPEAMPRHPAGHLKQKPVLAFSGIADNQGFVNTVADIGADMVDVLNFSDHHVYDEKDRHAILDAAKNAGADCLVTTEKDLVRLRGWDTGGLPLYALEIEIFFKDRKAFADFVTGHL